jgi:plastocyanin
MTTRDTVRAALAGIFLATGLVSFPSLISEQVSPAATEVSFSSTITIENFSFGPPLTVRPGQRVTVTNRDSAPHNLTATSGSFKTKNLGKGQSTTFLAPS